MKRFIHQCKHHGTRGLKHLWDHLVPHAGNDHHPHVLKHRVLAGYSVLLVLLKVLAIVAPVALPSSSLYSSAITPQNIVDLTNQTRTNLDLPLLAISDKLMQAAVAKAQDMAANQYFAHTSPAGKTPWSWIAGAGYKYKYAGENLAVHFTSAEGVQEGWLASPGHRANIVNQNYTEIGVGVAMGEYEGFPTTFVVQMFGTLAQAAAPVAAVTVPSSEPAQPLPAETVPPASAVAAAEEPAHKLAEQPQAPVEPEPRVIIPTKQAAALAQLDESSVAIIQQDGYYDLRLKVTGAESVAAYLGTSWHQLVAQVDEPEIWSGSVPYDSSVLSASGEQLAIVATNSDGATAHYALAWLAPQAQTQQFYTFNEGSDRYAKVFSFLTIHNLDDSVRQFYFFFMVFLAAALIINILVKIRVQELSVIGHTVFVLALTLLLMVV